MPPGQANSVAGTSVADAAVGVNRRALRTCAACLAAALLAGCQTVPTRTEAPPTPSVAADKEASAQRKAKTEALLRRAQAAFDAGKYLHPAADSAYTAWLAALAVTPDHPQALHGLELIVEHFIGRAQLAIERQRWATAASMLDRAAIVDAAHPTLPALRRQLRQLRGAERRHLDLEAAAVRSKSRRTAEALRRFGNLARRPEARVIIRAGSDSGARWIYEQLNRAPGDRRIRGEIEIGAPPRVTLLLLQETEN